MHRTALALPAMVFVAAACAGDAPSAPATARTGPTLLVAGQSRCHAVTGTISETGVFPGFVGTIAGDLVGTTATTALDVRFTGRAAHQPAERTLTITGGTIPELVGKTLHEAIDGTVVFPGTVTAINEHATVDQGARRGEMTEHGTLDASASPWTVTLTYHGTICP